MPALRPMPDPSACNRFAAGMGNPFLTSPRSPTWERPASSHEPVDPPLAVIEEAIEAALEALADAQAFGSEQDVEAAEARLERYQRVVVRHNPKEDDQPDDEFGEPEDDWSDVMWLDEEGGEHGA